MRLRTLALAAAIALAGPAFAKKVNITGFAPASTDVRITFNSLPPVSEAIRALATPADGTYEVKAGQLTGFLDGASFLTFCSEALADVKLGDPNTPLDGPDYDLLPAPPQFGAKRANDIGRLLTAGYATVTDSASAAAFQAAVWEIIYEAKPPVGTFPSYDLTNGSFMAEAVNAGNAPAFTGINSVLAGLGSVTSAYKVEVLVNEQFQDYLSISAVPEPGTYALLLAGLGVVGVVARRRKPLGG